MSPREETGKARAGGAAPPVAAARAKRPPDRARRVRLDQDTILIAAERILAQEGLDALTMRRVGTELQADPTAIYRYFRSKDELLVELADRAFGRVPLADRELGWREGLRNLGRHVREVYQVHPDFAAVLVRQADETPNLERLTEETLRLFREAGLSLEQAGLMYAVFVNVVAGTGLFYAVIGPEALSEPVRAGSRRTYASLPPDEFPESIAAAAHLFPDPGAVYELSIELLIDAVEAMSRRAVSENGADGRSKDDGRGT